MASLCSTESDPDVVPIDVSKLSLVPDAGGMYTVCFLADKRPKDWGVSVCCAVLCCVFTIDRSQAWFALI